MKRIEKYMIRKIKEAKPHIIEAFVHVYGDKYKDFITKRINDTEVFVCHGNIDRNYLITLVRALKNNNLNDPELIEGVNYISKYLDFVNNFNRICVNRFKAILPNLSSYTNADMFMQAVRNLKSNVDKLSKTKLENLQRYYLKCLGISYSKSNLEDNILTDKQIKELTETYYNLRLMKAEMEKELENNYQSIQESIRSMGYKKNKLAIRTDEELNKKTISYCGGNEISNKSMPICFFNLLNLNSSCENVYIHEFSHALDSNQEGKSGLCVDGKYISLNEAFNEASIIPVYDYMLEKGYHIFNDNPSKYSSSAYMSIIKIGKELINKFKDDIPTIKFGTKEDLFNLIEPDMLDRWDHMCYEILNTENIDGKMSGYLDFLESNIIKEIKEYDRHIQKR